MKRQWILLRGLAREQAHWDEFLKKFKENFSEDNVLSVDLPGAGVYYQQQSPWTLRGIAEDVYHNIPKKDETTPRILVAISLGGMVATELVKTFESEFQGLVLINSSFANLSFPWQRLQPRAVFRLLKIVLAPTLAERESEVLKMVSHRQDDHDLVKKWVQIAQQRPVAPLNVLKQLVASARAFLPKQKPMMPVLVLTSQGDEMVSLECSRKIAEQWQVPLQIHPSGGHELTLDEPDWVIEQIQKNFH